MASIAKASNSNKAPSTPGKGGPGPVASPSLGLYSKNAQKGGGVKGSAANFKK